MSRIIVPKTLEQIAAWPHKCGGVGSRGTPANILDVMFQAGRALCDVGYLMMSGEADGADFTFHEGARSSPRYPEVGFAAFIPWNGMRVDHSGGRVFEDWTRGIYDASKFHNYPQAEALALQARGSFEGLGRGGIGLHSRNPYQVLSPSLCNPVARLICWAEPVGKAGKVKGGTNTAVQVALQHNVPVVNLYYDEKVEQVLAFIKRVREQTNENVVV